VNTAREARLYRYKTDPKAVDEKGQPLVLPIIVDKHNHTWDAVRYSLDGYIQRGGVAGIWGKLGRARSE
jgi:phage terminase large subunit